MFNVGISRTSQTKPSSGSSREMNTNCKMIYMYLHSEMLFVLSRFSSGTPRYETVSECSRMAHVEISKHRLFETSLKSYNYDLLRTQHFHEAPLQVCLSAHRRKTDKNIKISLKPHSFQVTDRVKTEDTPARPDNSYLAIPSDRTVFLEKIVTLSVENKRFNVKMIWSVYARQGKTDWEVTITPAELSHHHSDYTTLQVGPLITVACLAHLLLNHACTWNSGSRIHRPPVARTLTIPPFSLLLSIIVIIIAVPRLVPFRESKVSLKWKWVFCTETCTNYVWFTSAMLPEC